MMHIHNGTLLSHKKNEITPSAATWMNLEIIIKTEVSQTEKDKHHMISHICGTRKTYTNRLIYKIEILIDMENRQIFICITMC